MITDRQKAFRQEYRSRIVGWYDGYIHILIIYAIGAAAFYIYVAHIHNARLMMEVNMNLTFPIADWLFGMSDLDRGIIGHVFNGYDARYLKKNLRGTPKPPDQAAAIPVGNF